MPENVESISPAVPSLASLRACFEDGTLSPLDVLEASLSRLRRYDPVLNIFVSTSEAVARSQAAEAERAYRAGSAGLLAGIPITIKDTFDVAGEVSTYGSRLYRSNIAHADSRMVQRLRAAGAVFIGKTNTAEFGQSATTDNMLGDHCKNPWDPSRTAGGSSGGAAVSVAAGIASAALGADGGGSIRIPAAFTGLVGFKPTFGALKDENSLAAMSPFCCPGPLTWTVADQRAIMSVLAETPLPANPVDRPLRVAFNGNPQGHPIDPAVAAAVARAAGTISSLGHDVTECEIPVDGWAQIFGPLVLEEEGRLRGHFLATNYNDLTTYARRTLEQAAQLNPEEVARARRLHVEYVERLDRFFGSFDLIVTPTTAVPAFPVGERPRTIDATPVDRLWGAFPFTAAFNVAGSPAISIPCGLADGLPVGLQIVAGRGRDGALLDAAEQIEQAIAFDGFGKLNPLLSSHFRSCHDA